MNKEIKGKNRVTQNHALVEALRDVHPLSLQESRIVLTAISTLQPSDTVFDSQRISVQDFLKLCDMPGTSHKVIKKACDSLFGKGVRIMDEDGKGFTNYPWFQKIKYIPNEGVVEFQFPNDLHSFLLELKKEEGFTSYRLENILQLSSAYIQRIYEICFKWKHAGSCEYELQNLKDLIGAVEKSYGIYGSFKQRILNPAVEEINKKTDIKIDFEEIKQGRKVVSINFLIESKDKKTKPTNEKPKYGYKPRKKIIREEPIPESLKNREARTQVIPQNMTKEEIDKMRQELLEELKMLGD